MAAMGKPDIFGILVGDIRATLGINQDELAAGLFRRDKLKKYESGEIELDKLEVDALLQRLGKTVDKYFIVLDSGEYRLAVMRTWIQVYLRRGKLAQAEDAIREYGEEHGADAPLHRQFLWMMKAELLRKSGGSPASQEEAILTGLSETLGGQMLSRKLAEDGKLHLMELFLVERYAAVLEERGECQEAVLWYESLVRRFDHERRELADRQKLYPFAAYRLASLYFADGRFDEALALVHKAQRLLEYSLISNSVFVLLKELEIKVKEAAGYLVSDKERAYMFCLVKMEERYKKGWRENYYPMYQESYLCCANDLIRERRIAWGIKCEELADGVCDTRTLMRIEKRKTGLQKRVRKGLLKKLGLSELKYNGGIVTGAYEDYKKYGRMVKLCDQSTKETLEEAWLVYQDLLGRADLKYLTNRQFKEYWGSVLRCKRGEITQAERNRRLWAMLRWTLPQGRNGWGSACWLTEYERIALGIIAWDCDDAEIGKLMPLLKGQYQRQQSAAVQVMETGTYGETVYCLARGYLRQGNIIRAEKYVTLRLAQTYYEDRGMSWSRLLFLQFQIEEEKRGLLKKENPLEGADADAFQWAKNAWAVAKSTHEEAMCRFMEDYFRRNYPTAAKYLD